MELQEHYSFFIAPFYFDDNINPEKSGEWEECMIAFDKSKFYPHIQELLINDDAHNNTVDYRYFRPVLSSPLWNNLKGDKCIISNDEAIRFRINLKAENNDSFSDNFFSPKLILNTNTGVGLFIFCVEVCDKSIDNVMNLNYALHKTYGLKEKKLNTPIFDVSQIKLIKTKDSKVDIEAIKEGIKKKKQNIIKLFGEVFSGDSETDWYWTFSQLAIRALSSIGNVERFDSYRFHVLTFLKLKYDIDELSPNDIIRLSHIQTPDYDVAEYEFAMVKSSFNNIKYSSCTEGGTIVVIEGKTATDFISGFSSDPLKNYLWCYLMVLIQRHNLLNIERKFVKIDFNNKASEDVKKDLRNCIKQFTTNQANTWFADVSNFSHLNMFYRHCCNNLLLKEHNADAMAKIKLLGDYVEVLDDEENGKSKKRTERMIKLITAVVAVLALFSALNDGYSFMKHDGGIGWLPDGPVGAWWTLLIVVGLGFVIWIGFSKSFFKNNNKSK